MSLSPFDSFQSRFVTYLLNRPHTIFTPLQDKVFSLNMELKYVRSS